MVIVAVLISSGLLFAARPVLQPRVVGCDGMRMCVVFLSLCKGLRYHRLTALEYGDATARYGDVMARYWFAGGAKTLLAAEAVAETPALHCTCMSWLIGSGGWYRLGDSTPVRAVSK